MKPKDAPEPALTTKQAAALYGVTAQTVRNWIRTGFLKAERVGPRLWRIPAAGKGGPNGRD